MRKLWMAMLLMALAGCGSGSQSPKTALLWGDSISIGYASFVHDELDGKIAVQHAPGPFNGNGRDTSYSLDHINDWLAAGGPVDVIHANWGLWDMSHSIAGANQPTNCDFSRPPRDTPEQYRANLEKLAAILEQTGSRIIWATTTPVPPSNNCIESTDVRTYNTILVDVAMEHGFGIDDLYTYILPTAAGLHDSPNSIHFTQDGYQMLSFSVSQSIEDQ